MTTALVCLGIVAVFVADAVLKIWSPGYARWRASLAARYRTWSLDEALGPVNPSLSCPHCQQVGSVRAKRIEQKKGVSGTKATAAILTGGVSLLATGLSRKEAGTQATCGNCKSTWVF